MRAALASDWLGDLREFDATTVAAACTRWRRGDGQRLEDGTVKPRRPTIADIRALCIEILPPRRDPPAPIASSPHPFATVEDFDWLGERDGERRSDEDSRRVRAYRAAAAALGERPPLADVLRDAPQHY